MRRSLVLLLVSLAPACGSNSTGHSTDLGSVKTTDLARASDLAIAIGGDDGGLFHGGNPGASCSLGIPTLGKPVDTSSPTSVVGSGDAASCTFALLSAAVSKGGIITFSCGSAPVTIAVTATMKLPVGTNTVIDGGNLITLDGGGAVQILNFNSPGYRTNDTSVTLQHLALVNGKATPMQAILPAPSPCSQGFDDGQGGAIFMRDGNLVVIDSIFTQNQAAPLGPDTGGGAIYIEGSKGGVLAVGCTFTNNSGSNAGAIGALNAELDLYESLVTGNTATGHDANNNDPKQCTAMNAGQNEIGSGGNGGAIYGDGDGFNIVVCGDAIENNAAGVNAFGGGIFFTSDDFSGTLTIADSTISGNTGGHWTSVKSGSMMNAGTAVGTNAKSLTITNSTVQGVP